MAVVGNTAAPPQDEFVLWPQSGAGIYGASQAWSFGRPGKYCVGLVWEVDLPDGGVSRNEQTLTFVVDRALDPTMPQDSVPGFEHRPDTLTKAKKTATIRIRR